MLSTIGLVVNRSKKGAQEAVTQIKTILSSYNVTLIDDNSKVEESARDNQLDAIIVLGGDGTVLRTAAKFACYQVPILGVNIGKLGFITELVPEELKSALPEIIKGKFYIRERMMLKSFLLETKEKIVALNDITIDKGASARGIDIIIYVSDVFLGRYFADGIIVSTPTGSTAYSMAAGGAIVSPKLDAILVTAICPYTMAIRPIVVSATETVRIEYSSRDKPVCLNVDGVKMPDLKPKGSITIGCADKKALLISYHNRSFYEVLRRKLRWGCSPLENEGGDI